jgi:hypothetical protein
MRPSIDNARGASSRTLLVVGVGCLLVIGCGKGGLPSKVVFGTVTVAGQKVEGGQVRFVPVEGTPGSANAAQIVDGQYRIEGRGGVAVGKHRVEVTAMKKTGRKVQRHNGFEMAMVDEEVRVSPPRYAGEQSPLLKEVTPDFDGQIDIDIPKQ